MLIDHDPVKAHLLGQAVLGQTLLYNRDPSTGSKYLFENNTDV